MDDLRLVQDPDGLAYDRRPRGEEGGSLAILGMASRLRRSKNNETGLIRSLYSGGLNLLKGREDSDTVLKPFLTSRALHVTYLDTQSSMQLGL